MSDADTRRNLQYAAALGNMGALLDDQGLEFIAVVEIDGSLVARAQHAGTRDFEQITVDDATYSGHKGDGRYARLLTAIGRWLDQRGATEVVLTEGEQFLAVGGRAPIPTSGEGYIMGPFEELLLPDEVDALIREPTG